jgi:hypothetical protein
MTAIDRYVRQLTDRLPAAGGLRERVREEVAGHLADAADALRRDGVPPAEAEELAVARFGSPESVARRFREELGLLLQAAGALLRPWPAPA